VRIMENIEYIISPTIQEPVAVRAKSLSLDAAINIWRSAEESDSENSRPGRPYEQVDIVFNCVSKLIDSIASLPLVFSTPNEDIVESGPAWDFLFNNTSLSYEQFIYQAVGHYALSRDVFLVFPNKSPGRPPTEMYIVNGVQMHPITHNRQPNGEHVGWEFRGSAGQKAEFSLDEVYQWKNFNPYDRFHGLGPATAAKLNINYTYAATLFNSSALENGAAPGVFLTTPAGTRIDPEERRHLLSTFEARHKGSPHAKRTALLTGGMDAKTVAMNMVEMQIAELTNMSSRRVCSTFGVSPELVGLATESQYAHGPAQRDFIFNTIIPLSRMLASVITNALLAKFSSVKPRGLTLKETNLYIGRLPLKRIKSFTHARHKAIGGRQQLFAWFDDSQHPVIQEYQRETAEKVVKLTESGVPLNQIIDAHDLPYDTSEIPWGNDWWVGMGQIPARFTLEAGLEGLTGPAYTEPEPDNEDDDSKTIDTTKTKDLESQDLSLKANQTWQKWTASWHPLEKEFNSALRKFFLRQQRILTDKLKAAYRDLSPPDKSVAKDITDDLVARVVFDLRQEDTKLKVINKVFFGKSSELGIRQSITESLQLKGDKLTELTEQVKLSPKLKSKLTISTHKITGVNKTTQATVQRHLKQALQRGDTLNDLTRIIQKDLGSNLARAQTIARTQTASAVSSGRHEGFRSVGLKGKSWITAGDEHVRAAHKQAGLNYAAPIPLDQPFIVAGESLAHPGDPAGSAGNIINCRCLEIAAALAQSKSILTFNFYSYSEMLRDQSLSKDRRLATDDLRNLSHSFAQKD